MKKHLGIFAVSLLLTVGNVLFAQEEPMSAEMLAFDFLQRLLFSEEEDWDNEYVQKMLGYLSEEKQTSLFDYKEAFEVLSHIPIRKNIIAEKVQKLTDDEKEKLYADYKETTPSPFGMFGFNMLVPGLGSFIQGNLIGGLAQVFTYSIGYVTLFSFLADGDYTEEVFNRCYGRIVASSVASSIIGTVMPFLFSAITNATVRSAIGVDKEGKVLPKSEPSQNVVLLPTFNPVENAYGLSLALRF